MQNFPSEFALVKLVDVKVTGRFANVSVRQRPVRQRMKSFRQRLMSVRQRLYVSSPTSKIFCEIDLKCIYKLPKEDNVTFDPR